MKHEWRKKEKKLYLPKTTPELIDVPPLNYIIIEGQGNPNTELFENQVGALYALSYTIRMAPKQHTNIPGYYEYTVYPLEGIWSLNEEGKELYDKTDINELKDYFTYTIMIRQPEFVTEELFESMKEIAYKKKKIEEIKDARFVSVQEGLNLQMMHIGPYNEEPKSFQIMEEYCRGNNLERISKTHKEIYLSDPRKVDESKMKTVLRFKVNKK